jgi:adenosylcobinamide-GDP ribazoletransferase
LGIAIPLLGTAGFIVIISGLIASLIMVEVSRRHFGGVTGDVMGAMNEIIRMFSLITILVAVRWV